MRQSEKDNSKHKMFIRVSYEYKSFALVDNNECSDSAANGCFSNAYCTNTLGSYRCSCPSDYILKGDGKTCECKLSYWFIPLNFKCILCFSNCDFYQRWNMKSDTNLQ